VPLRALQHRFQAHLLDGPRAAAGGAVAGIIESIVDAPPLPATARLDIYAHAYRARLRDALQDTYPTLHQILGDEVFADLARGFIERHPSVHRSIRWYGREVADHLGREAPYADQPALAEIARFEWILSEAFDAADAAVLDRTALQRIDPADWAELRFDFHPSLRRLPLEWNSVAIWQAIHREQSPPEPARGDRPVPWIVWRQGFKNFFRSLDGAESAALDVALSGAAFGEICETLGAWLPAEEVPLRAAMLIGGWTESGLLAGCRASPG